MGVDDGRVLLEVVVVVIDQGSNVMAGDIPQHGSFVASGQVRGLITPPVQTHICINY